MFRAQKLRPARAERCKRAARWSLAGLALCWSPGEAEGAPSALATVVGPSRISALQDGLERLLVEASAGRLPSVAAVDEALASVAPIAAGRFTGAVQRAAEVGQPGAAELLALIAGFPQRTLEWAAGHPELRTALIERVDIGLAVLQVAPDGASIATATALAGERLVAPDGAREARRRLQVVLEAALAQDERRARKALERAFVDARAGLEPAIVDALRAADSAGHLQTLAALLRQRAGADGLVLNRLHALALRLGPVLDEAGLRQLRTFLDSGSAFERVGAARALGALEDRGALPSLVSLLRDPDRSVRSSAHDALRRITAMTIGPSPDRWARWVEREEDWWREHGAQDLAFLAQADRREALIILREAAQHRLYRAEIAAAALPLLGASDAELVRIGLATLESVRARGIELRVVDLLEHPSSTVRAQASSCLRGLTGRMLPADPSIWRKALDP